MLAAKQAIYMYRTTTLKNIMFVVSHHFSSFEEKQKTVLQSHIGCAGKPRCYRYRSINGISLVINLILQFLYSTSLSTAKNSSFQRIWESSRI